MTQPGTDKIIVGSEEWCALPALGIPAIKARVDSGARTSSLHAFNVQPFRRGNTRWVSFEVHPLQKNRRTIIRCEAEVVDQRVVKSSSGVGEKRYVIRTTLEHNGKSWDIELTLGNRDSMGYRMLLGREAMKGRILVDPATGFIGGKLSAAGIRRLYQEHTRDISGLRIGVLGSRADQPCNQRLLEAGEERGHRIHFHDIRHCYIKLDAETPEIYYRGGRLLNDLDAVIPRITPELTFYGCALLRHIEHLDIHSLNAADAMARSRDRLQTLQLLQKNGLDIPVTGFADSPVETDELIEMVGGPPLLVKILEGGQRRGSVMAESRGAVESLVSAFKALRINLLVQEYVREAEGKDLRLLVVNNRLVATMQRQGQPGTLNHAGSGEDAPQSGPATATAQERRMAIKAARISGLRVAGITMLRSRRGPLIIGVEPAPLLSEFEDVTGKDIAGGLISSIERALNWKRPLGSAVE